MHPVRSIAAAALLLCLTFYASAEESATIPGYNLGVVELALTEAVEMHGRRDDIGRICRSSYGVKGCTDFPVERLACECALYGDHWQIDVRAEVRAVIHVSRAWATDPVLRHERLHLEDLEGELRAHLGRIAARPYQSEKACRTYANVLTKSPHLRVVMNDIRVKSNEKYGCSKITSN